MYVPFIPRDLDSMTPADSNFLSALTITERVIPTLSAIFDEYKKNFFNGEVFALPPSNIR